MDAWTRQLYLAGALSLAAVLWMLARGTQRGQQLAGDVVGEIAVTAQRIGGAVAAVIARGLRNNNPGNIRHNAANDWLGMSSAQSDPAFVQFTHPKYGVRALARVLNSYTRRGVQTVAGLIQQWAPSLENNTAAYVSAVARELRVQPDQAIDVKSYLPRIAAAIIKHENGVQPYSIDDLTLWVYMA